MDRFLVEYKIILSEICPLILETPTTIDKMHPPILMFNDLKEGEGAFLF